jgi:hypothetical protein
VHNQLTGYSRVFGCGLKIRSTCVGGLHQRCDRSIPPLLELWRLASEGDSGGDLVVNGIPIPTGEVRQHAAFFLARMFTAAGDKEKALPWFRICEQALPGARVCGALLALVLDRHAGRCRRPRGRGRGRRGPGSRPARS